LQDFDSVKYTHHPTTSKDMAEESTRLGTCLPKEGSFLYKTGKAILNILFWGVLAANLIGPGTT
jgi:hypothetical protein